MGCGASQPAGAAYIDEAIVKSESFAAVKIAIEGESAIVSIDTSPTARSSPAKQHATQPARSSPLAG